MITEEALIRAVRAHPGQTSNEIASRLGANPTTISGRLSRFALYGKLDREIVRKPPGQRGPSKWFLYRVREADRAG